MGQAIVAAKMTNVLVPRARRGNRLFRIHFARAYLGPLGTVDVIAHVCVLVHSAPRREAAMRFDDRQAAGRALALELARLRDRNDVVVLALPRGGVPVAFEVAAALHVPLDVLVVRKLGVPGREELAMGAVASGGVRVVSRDIVEGLRIPEAAIEAVAVEQEAEVERRERLYRGGCPPLEVRGKTVVLIDDGVATGATMHAAVESLREREPAAVIVAVPTAAEDSMAALRPEVDELVCLDTPAPYIAVGRWYRRFEQVDDDTVRALLDEARRP